MTRTRDYYTRNVPSQASMTIFISVQQAAPVNGTRSRSITAFFAVQGHLFPQQRHKRRVRLKRKFRGARERVHRVLCTVHRVPLYPRCPYSGTCQLTLTLRLRYTKVLVNITQSSSSRLLVTQVTSSSRRSRYFCVPDTMYK